MNVVPLTPPKPLVPPVNYEAEQALLGAVIANNDVFHQVDAFLRPEHFADALHGRIYAACAKLIADGTTADIVTLKRLLDQDLALQAIPAYRERGGSAYAIQLATSVVSLIGAVDYAREIVECYTRRNIMAVCETFLQEAAIVDVGVNAARVIESLEGHLAKISDELTTQRSVASAADAAASALALIDRAMRSPNHITGLPTGIGDLDYRLGGLREGLIILAGRPSMGKTTLALKFLHENSVPDARGRRGVYLASQEMSRDQIGQKLIALQTGIDTDRQSRGQMNEAEFERVIQATRRIAEMDFEVDDASGQTVASIQSRARRYDRRLRAKGGRLVMIVIDYLQLMRSDLHRGGENRVQELSEITRALKQMQKNLGVPVLALSQLSRAVEMRDDKRPQLADLRESGSIEQDADVVIFLYRDEYYLSRQEPKRGNMTSDKFHEKLDEWNLALARSRNVAETIIAKNRMGKAPMLVEVYFNQASGDFTSLRRTDAGDATGDGYAGGAS